MLFASQSFLLVFLPLVVGLYYAVADSRRARQAVVIGASLLFYGLWDWRFLPFLLGLTGFNQMVAMAWGARGGGAGCGLVSGSTCWCCSASNTRTGWWGLSVWQWGGRMRRGQSSCRSGCRFSCSRKFPIWLIWGAGRRVSTGWRILWNS
ncbi:hypothetical protein RAA17_06990 [Komagataeibacter rhaeticus]|nr:hypothetical protein [Komagataeibacter rhaeticus]